MRITRTITIDGDTNQEYADIKTHLEALHDQHPEWVLIPEPLVNRVTAVKVEEVADLTQTS